MNNGAYFFFFNNIEVKSFLPFEEPFQPKRVCQGSVLGAASPSLYSKNNSLQEKEMKSCRRRREDACL